MQGEPLIETAPSLSHAQFLRIALDALSVRAARWLTLVLSFALFGYTLLEPSWIRLATAAAGAPNILVIVVDTLRADQLRPNHRDAKPNRGPLADVGEGTAHVMDMGAPRGEYPWNPTTSPATATFIAAPPVHPKEKKEKEEGVTIHTGIKRH